MSKINLTKLDVKSFFPHLNSVTKVDLWITDPPYPFNNQNGTGRMKYEDNQDEMYSRMTYSDLEWCYSEMFTASNSGAGCYVFANRDGLFHTKDSLEKAGWIFRNILVWDKCLGPDTKVMTTRGVVKISEISTNDFVYTPKGLKSRVVATSTSKKKALKIGLSNGSDIVCSDEHPFLTVDGHEILARDLHIGKTLMSRSGSKENPEENFYLAESISDEDLIVEMKDQKICMFCSEIFKNKRAAAAHQARFCKNKKSKNDMAKEIGISKKALGWWLNSGRLPYLWAKELNLEFAATGKIARKMQSNSQNLIKNKISLNYSWGKLIGLYAAEGSRSKNNVSFALHKNEKHLQNHIERTVRELGMNASVRTEEDGNRCVVNVGSRLLSDIIAQFVCGNNSKNKYFSHRVYESGSEFKKGIFDGLIEGDGHWNRTKKIEEYSSASHDLSLFVLRQARDLGYEPKIFRLENLNSGGWKVKFDPQKQKQDISVIDIENIGEQTLYDISIEDEDHLYLLGDGIVTHNCNMTMGYHWRNQVEYIVYCTKGATKKYVTGLPNIFHEKKPTGLSAKPPKIWETIMEQQLKDGEVVCDPFAGSDPLSFSLNNNQNLMQKLGASYSNIFP
jgi:N6-adenosine-specific RNA methylase IME4